MAKKNGASKIETPAIQESVNMAEQVIDVEQNESETEPKGPQGEKREMIPATKAYGLTADQIAAAIEAGEIANVGSTDVTIRAKSSPTKKDEVLPYEKLVALNFDGMLLLSGGKMEPKTDAPETGKDERSDDQKLKGAADHFNYGRNLDVNREVSRLLSEQIEGPAKIIKAAAERMVAAGMFTNVDEATAFVKERRAAQGLAV
jgi:hypothetical protein